MATEFYYDTQQLYFSYARALALNTLAYNRFQDASSAWGDENYPLAIYHTYHGGLNLQAAQLEMLDPNASGMFKFRITKLAYLSWEYTWEEPPAAEVTMAAILDAMLKAEPHQPLLFVYYLEAYKASVWNATFNEQQLAELSKKWMVWG